MAAMLELARHSYRGSRKFASRLKQCFVISDGYSTYDRQGT